MLCCTLGAGLLAAGITWWQRMRDSFAPRRAVIAGGAEARESSGLQLLLAGAAIALAASAYLTHHFDHYSERAKAQQSSVLAEILAAPVCKGQDPGPPRGDRL